MDSFRSISRDELNNILKKHTMWLDNEPGGERANLRGADLSGADLRDINLIWADLSLANLCRANLCRANLRRADLIRADLSVADLSEADLSCANLGWAKLCGADLREANLSDAYLIGANLSDAYLIGTDLSRAKLYEAALYKAKLDWPLICPEKGSFVGYKKCRDNLIVKLEIPEDALRSSSTTGKCRCSKAKVLSITDPDESEVNAEYAVSKKDSGFFYKVGEVVSVNDFDTNRWNECSTGIHFFMTREEAVEYIC